MSVGSDVLPVVPSSWEGVFPPSFGDSLEHISILAFNARMLKSNTESPWGMLESDRKEIVLIHACASWPCV